VKFCLKAKKVILGYYPFGLTHKGYNTEKRGRVHNHHTYNSKEIENELGLNWIDYGARRYQADIGRWTTTDPASDEYVGISHYSYAANNPLVFIDPDGRRLFFVGGANNDQDGWEYITRWGNYMTDAGIKNFVRVNASTGQIGDIAFTNNHRNSGLFAYPNGGSSGPIPGQLSYDTGVRARHGSIETAYGQIKENLEEHGLEEGEQLNLVGYSFGSVLQAQVALKLADEGTYIDNLVLIGSPISDDSDLFKELNGNKNIGKVTRVDIKGDLLSNPKDVLEFIKGGHQNGPKSLGGDGDDGAHFDLARKGEKTNNLIQTVIQWLQEQGVE